MLSLKVYPPWRWYEKQDGIRSLQKKDKDPAPEFYNIVFERPKVPRRSVTACAKMFFNNYNSKLDKVMRPVEPVALSRDLFVSGQ